MWWRSVTLLRRYDVNCDVTSTRWLRFNCIAYLQDLTIHVSGLFYLLFGFANWRSWFLTYLASNNMNVLNLSHIYILFSNSYRELTLGLLSVLKCTELHCCLLSGFITGHSVIVAAVVVAFPCLLFTWGLIYVGLEWPCGPSPPITINFLLQISSVPCAG